MKEDLKDIKIDAELSVETNSGSVSIFSTDDIVNVDFSNWDTLKESRKMIPGKYKSLKNFNSFNKLLFNSGVKIKVSVDGENIARLGEKEKPDIKITKLLFGSIFN